jgi:hypothetical protein
VRIKIYAEGGGDVNALKTKCRQGFSEFFRKAGLEGRMPHIVASGSRQDAYDDFCMALKNAKDGEFIVLLVDSEAAVAAADGPWSHLKTRDNWDKPATATDDNVHLMVWCMEAWFIADRGILDTFFGQHFNVNALPAREEIETITKSDLFNGLKSATHHCTPKGEYSKGRHSFKILAQIDPAKVMAASPYAKRLVDTLLEKA